MMIRDTENSILGGVCAGLANNLNTDRTAVRAVFVLLMLGLGFLPLLLAYMIAWLMLDTNCSAKKGHLSAEKAGKAVQEDMDKIATKLKTVEAAFSSAAKSFKSELNKEDK